MPNTIFLKFVSFQNIYVYIHQSTRLSHLKVGINSASPTARFLAFQAPALLHFDNETARDKRAQSRATPPYAPTPSHTTTSSLRGGWLNGISVNASFEWIFDCVVYDWIYFLPSRPRLWLRRNFANPCYIYYTSAIFFVFAVFFFFYLIYRSCLLLCVVALWSCA